MKEKTIKFLLNYFDEVYSVTRPNGINYIGVEFFEIKDKGRKKILGLEDELIHWLVEKENKRLGFSEQLKNFENGDIQILFDSGKVEWK